MSIIKKRIDAFNIINYLFLVIIGFITIFPFINTLALAFNDGLDSIRGGIFMLPRRFTWDNVLVVATNDKMYNALFITIARTVIGTILSLLLTSLFSYAMSKSYLVGRKFYMGFCLVTMYFGGGLIPTYLLVRSLHLVNNFLVYIIPGLVSVWNMILMVTYFKGIPAEIEESAKIDGARDFTIFFSIILHISKPILAVIALYNAVGQWNSWFDTYLYVTVQNLKPLQYVLIDIINASSVSEMLPSTASFIAHNLSSVNNITSKSVTAATMLFTVGPIIFVYPFVQKYFVKGVMIGSVKG